MMDIAQIIIENLHETQEHDEDEMNNNLRFIQ